MRDNRDILDKLRWLSNDMEYMEVPGEWILPVAEAHSIIVRQREEVERLRAALRMLYDEMDEYQRINNLSAYNNQVMRQARSALEEK